MTIDAYCVLGVDREYDLGEDALLRAMDAGGVARAVIASPDRFLAVHNKAGNDALLRAASAHPDRLIPSCSASPWYGEAAVAEVRRAVDQGARVLVLHPAVQGYLADDDLAHPLLEVAAAERVLVYLHTGPPGSATPWQVAALAERFPALDFVMGHCGATDFWNDVVVAAFSAPNVYLEASFARPFAFSGYVKQLGADRGLMGSFAPLNYLPFEWEQMRKLLPADEWPGVYGENLLRLLRKRGSLV